MQVYTNIYKGNIDANVDILPDLLSEINNRRVDKPIIDKITVHKIDFIPEECNFSEGIYDRFLSNPVISYNSESTTMLCGCDNCIYTGSISANDDITKIVCDRAGKIIITYVYSDM